MQIIKMEDMKHKTKTGGLSLLIYLTGSHIGTADGLYPIYSTNKATNATLLTNLKTIKLGCEESSRIDFDQKVDVFILGKNWFFKI